MVHLRYLGGLSRRLEGHPRRAGCLLRRVDDDLRRFEGVLNHFEGHLRRFDGHLRRVDVDLRRAGGHLRGAGLISNGTDGPETFARPHFPAPSPHFPRRMPRPAGARSRQYGPLLHQDRRRSRHVRQLERHPREDPRFLTRADGPDDSLFLMTARAASGTTATRGRPGQGGSAGGRCSPPSGEMGRTAAGIGQAPARRSRSGIVLASPERQN